MKIKIKPCKIHHIRRWLTIPDMPLLLYRDLEVLASGNTIDASLHRLGTWYKNYDGREITVAYSGMAYEVKEDE